ncbi:MAG: fibronectin type III domain-containing protein [Verrucomicrobiota bacterium]
MILNIDNFASTQWMVKAGRLADARAYEARARVGSQEWKPAGVFTKARGMLLPGLIPGTMYDVQVRGVGGSTGCSDWSDSVSHMAT